MNKLSGNRNYMKEIRPINHKLSLWARQLMRLGHVSWAIDLYAQIRKMNQQQALDTLNKWERES